MAFNRIDFDPTNASKGAEGEIRVIGHEVTNPPSSPSSFPPPSLPAVNRGRVVVPLSAADGRALQENHTRDACEREKKREMKEKWRWKGETEKDRERYRARTGRTVYTHAPTPDNRIFLFSARLALANALPPCQLFAAKMTRNKVTFLFLNARSLILFKIINLECRQSKYGFFMHLIMRSLLLSRIRLDIEDDVFVHVLPDFISTQEKGNLFSSSFSSSSFLKVSFISTG